MHVCKGKSKGNVAFSFAIKVLEILVVVPYPVHAISYSIDILKLIVKCKSKFQF